MNNKNKGADTYLCIGFIDNKVVTGTYKGELLLWDKDTCSSAYPMFKDSPILAMC